MGRSPGRGAGLATRGARGLVARASHTARGGGLEPHRRDSGCVRVRGVAHQGGARGGPRVLHRRGHGDGARRRPVREPPLEEAARRVSGGRRAALPLPLGGRAGPAVDGSGRLDRALAGRLRARVVDRPGNRRRDGTRHPARRRGARAVDTGRHAGSGGACHCAPARPARPAAVTPARATPLASPTPPAPRRDSLPWTVQLIAYARLDKALGLADRIGAEGIVSFVTPVAIGPRRSTIWYRVLAGGYRTRDSAVAVRAALWDRGLSRRGQGDVLRAPYSYAVSGSASADELHRNRVLATRRPARGG